MKTETHKTTIESGEVFGREIRHNNQYDQTQAKFQKQGLSKEVLNQTPPVGINLVLLTKLEEGLEAIRSAAQLSGQEQFFVSILGLAIAQGVNDFDQFFRHTLGFSWDQLTVVDIDNDILNQVKDLGHSDVLTLHQDARDTSIETASQWVTLRDHLGNCCPPEIDKAINAEVERITQTEGVAIVNITTSDLIPTSADREVVTFNQLLTNFGPEVIEALNHHVFTLTELEDEFDIPGISDLRGKLLEINPVEQSFVIFAEAGSGQGEWFRSWQSHLHSWKAHGFTIVDLNSRTGLDSHQPPLNCLRHNVILQKGKK